MIDLKDLRENPQRYKTAAQQKRIDVDIDRLLELDAKRRELDSRRQQLTAEKNAAGKPMGPLMGKLKEAPPAEQAAIQDEVNKIQARSAELKQQEQLLETQVTEL